ncbi:hypothetical protein GUA46_06880 [Muricauda sp. HICW]|uniref:YD repeat-containing protein n=1 Tax=Flagellimonas chongwuensis TaxID=2697365 RepID=A0A850NI68_9FLAO|nr:RHS repeat domain-containing protein [Allomuricauda chongwuensis]NVN18058.1 hypothetical protein [Allomuricauda chongwuensis]
MRKTKPSHRILAVFLTLNFLTTLVPINLIYASGGGPGSPEAASFEPVDATDMVNLATGDLSYVMPLLNVPSPEGGYPLALSYHAGIGLDQEASWVGLGWNINPGAINRSVAGVPDDWLETKKYTMLYNDIGVHKSISFGGTGIIMGLSVATQYNYSSFKATGGETTRNFSNTSSIGLPGVGGVSTYIGTDGIGIGAYGSFGIGKNDAFDLNAGAFLFQSFKGEGLSGNVSLGASKGFFGTGMTLSSNGSLSSSLSIGGMNLLSSEASNLDGSVHSKDLSSFKFKTPQFLPFSLNFSYKKTKYWIFDASYATYNGALYAGKIEDTYQNTVAYRQLGIDAYESLYEADTKEQLRNSNFSFINYDSYGITGQGIGGTMAPKILEEGTLIMPKTTLRTKTTGGKQVPESSTWYYKPEDGAKNFSKSIDQGNVHFYFENEYTSALQVGSGIWNIPLLNMDDIHPTEYSTVAKSFDDSSLIDGQLYDSYNEENERIRKGRYVETFTNEQIIQNESLIITPSADGFDRNPVILPSEGIGAFKVTALDGKTYHYSLPVYSRVEFSRVANVDDNMDDKFYEEQQFEPYATHWLLTAVTGPDYIDKNGNNKVDEEDYGYWVDFEYGKWSDGLAWRTPSFGVHTDGNTKSYSWGIKEVYYLDKVKTRTHTALFIKGEREDNKSYAAQISDGDEPKYYYLPSDRTYIADVDDNMHLQGAHLNIEIGDLNPNLYYCKSHFWFKAELEEQKSLRLEKIILLKNSEAENIKKSNIIDPDATLAGIISAEARVSLYYLWGEDLGYNEEQLIPINSWHGEFYNKTLNTNDIDWETVTPKSLKTIEFNYDETYPLGRETDGNIELPGKLTLNSVSTLGKGGVQLIPPYKFDYYAKNTVFDKDDIDDWGYYKNQAMMYSLNRITTPLGGSIDITYENDSYVNEYASPTTYFSHGLEFRFGGTANGPKTLSFRNDPEIDEKYHVNFKDFFEAGESTEIDVTYWHYTHTESNWIGDFADKNCLVQEVGEDLVVFSLPVKNKVWGREFENCQQKEWAFYDNEFGDVVNQTSEWLPSKDENSCERPAEGDYRARYTIFAQKEPLNIAEGGGIRVKKIEMASDAYSAKTVYSYTNPDNIGSGVTSYAPSKRNRSVPYISEMPNPMVIYEHVTTEKLDANDNLVYKNSYQFNVPKPLQYTQNGVLVENAFEIKRLQDENIIDVSLNEEDVDMNFSKFEVKDFSSSIGRLVQSTEYNSENQQVYKVENSYMPQSSFFNQGIIKESFNSYKQIWDNPFKDSYIMTSSSKEKIPNVLLATSITRNGYTSQQQFLKYDFYTGQVIETSAVLSNGKQVKSTIYPAYHRYPAMGSKVDNPSNKNMLAQEAATYHLLNDNDNWEVLNASINTWRDWGENIWRKHKTYRWNGEMSADGFYLDFDQENDDNFNWQTTLGGDDQTNSDWEQISEITQYNDFSSPLEVMDINGNLAATKMGYGDSKTIAVSNAGYNETFYSGAEDDDGQGNFGGGVGKGNASKATDTHTGSNSLLISNGGSGFEVTVNHSEPAKTYKISLWSKKAHYHNVRVNVEGENIDFNPDEIITAEQWVQLNFYAKMPSGTPVSVTSVNGNVVVDDFRLHPVASSMTSYVYNEWDELTDILGPNNLATKYEYDEAGRLVRIYSEVLDVDGQLSGGFKKVKEYAYNYKPSNDAYNQMSLNLGVQDFNANNTNVVANVSGGSGQFEYQWSVKYCQDPDPQDPTVCPGNLQPTFGNWTPQNTLPITTDCNGTRAVYWCRVRDMITQTIAEDAGNHKRGNCNGDNPDNPLEEQIP